MIRGYRTFKEFERSGEGIATNILANRLERLEQAGIITNQEDPRDGRKLNYRLTTKGIELAPVLLELLIWGGQNEKTDTPCALIEQMAKDRERLLYEVRTRWQNNDPSPLQVNGRWIFE